MTPARLLPAFGLAAAAVAVIGCHKETTRAYQPPAPPASTEAHNSRSPSDTPKTSARSPSARANRDTANDEPAIAKPPPPAPELPPGPPISTEVGLASWYGPPYNHHAGADGSIYDQDALTAAHRTLPMGSIVRVTNLATGQTVVVRITDRGPFVPGRILDLSLAAAKATGLYRMGVAKVRVEVYAHGGTPSDPLNEAAARWCVQIGAFLDPADAVQLKNDLSRRYANAKVIEFAGPTGHWVRINPAQPDRSHATEIANSIHVPDAEPYLIRTN